MTVGVVCSVRASWIPLSSDQDKRDIECRFADEGDGGMEFYQPTRWRDGLTDKQDGWKDLLTDKRE